MRLFIISISLLVGINYVSAKSEIDEEYELARQIIAKQRSDVVTRKMDLTAFEEKQFLGVYNRYRDEMKPVIDKQVKLLNNYTTAYKNKSLTDDKALEFTNTLINLTETKWMIRKKYVTEFRTYLKPKQVARFIQIENKLDAIMNYHVSQTVPLIPTK